MEKLQLTKERRMNFDRPCQLVHSLGNTLPLTSAENSEAQIERLKQDEINFKNKNLNKS